MASNTYSQGAQVEHLKFGLGQVLSSNEERIVIKFDDHDRAGSAGAGIGPPAEARFPLSDYGTVAGTVPAGPWRRGPRRSTNGP